MILEPADAARAGGRKAELAPRVWELARAS
jgi:hypothetical protein